MRLRKAAIVVFAAMMIVGVAAPSMAATSSAGPSVGVTQDATTGAATVTVTTDGAPVENATVEVAAVGNDSYAGNGTYETDANGTVTLPEPNATVTVDVTATVDGNATTRTVDLVPLAESVSVDAHQNADGTALVTVIQYGDPVENATVEVATVDNASYAGNGTYETDADGTVSLPAPAENRTVDVTATADGVTGRTTVDLVAPLDVTVDQADDGSATVTVAYDGTPVENATVEVAPRDNASYAGNGTYETDANGTVSLPAPTADLTVDVTATADGRTGRTTAALDVPFGLTVEQFDDGSAQVTVMRGDDPVENATVEVTAVGNASYAGNGTYGTDANGTVSLPAPDQDVEVAVNATDGNDTAETTLTLYATEKSGPFGRMISAFVHGLLDDGEHGIGHQVSAYAREHNPGNAPEHAGPPEKTGKGHDDHGKADSGADRKNDHATERADDGTETASGTETADRNGRNDGTETGNGHADDHRDDGHADDHRDDGHADDHRDDGHADDNPGHGGGNGHEGNGPPDHAGR